MKNVLLLTSIGGFVPQFEMNDVKLLKELGCNIHYASNFKKPVYELNEKELEKQNIKMHQIDIQKSPLKIIRNIRSFFQLMKIVKENNIDTVHCHNPVGGLLGRAISMFYIERKITTIYTAHGFHFYEGAPLKNWLLYYPVERFMARFSDVIITINKEDYQSANKFRLRKNGKIYQIPGVGVHTKKFQLNASQRMQLREKMGIPEDSFFVLSVGELNDNKNHQIVLDAISKMKNCNILYGVCGSGTGEYKLKKLSETLKVENKFRLFGFCTNIPEMLRCADCFVFPSKREGFGIAAVEAMAGGVPLITSDCRGTREYMRHEETGYICYQNSSDEYKDAIEKIMNKEINEEFSKRCKEHSRYYDISMTEQIMKKIYREIQRAL